MEDLFSCMQDSLCGQSEDSSSDDSFCIQMQVKSTQAETKLPAPQHLVTNVAFKLKHHKMTQYLRARIDTCTDVNILPVSVYKLIFKDTDCKKLAASSKEIGTYTDAKIKIIGSCKILVVHPETQNLKEVTFQVTHYEGSVVFTCMTTLELGLIQPCENLESIPSCDSLIYSAVDHPHKNRSQMKNNIPSVQEKNNLSLYLSQRSTMLISVFYRQIRIPQASRSTRPMSFI